METNQRGGFPGRKVPSKLRFRPSSQRYSLLLVSTQNSPKIGPNALGIAIPAVQPEIQPFFGFGSLAHICTKNGDKWPKMGPNGRQRVHSGVLWCPSCVPCAPNGPRSITDPNQGPPGACRAVFGRFWPRYGPVFGGGYPTIHFHISLSYVTAASMMVSLPGIILQGK